MTDTEKRIAEIERDNTSRLPMPSADVEWLIAELRASQAECAKLEGIYASAVNGRAEMRTALKEERAKRPLGITEWSTVENVERVIAERDALKAKLAEAVAHLEAALRKAAANEREHCKCATCCLPTIVAERDEAMSAARQLVSRCGELSDELASEKQRTINVFVRLDKAESERDAAVNDANRQKDQHERLRVSLAVALGLLSEMEYWRQLTGTRFEAPLRNFLADMRAGR